MTTRQKAYIEALIQERAAVLARMAEPQMEGQDAIRARFVLQPGMLARVNTGAASVLIDWLRGISRDEPVRTNARPANEPGVDVPAGRYALVDEQGVTKFYVVDRPEDGRWAGYTFLNALGSDERYPIRDRSTKARILGEIAADLDGARVRYGMEIGRCACCGRTLTDETSRAAGIGPDCARIYGIDRTAYTRIAEAQAAARETTTDRGADRGEDDGIDLGAARPEVPVREDVLVDLKRPGQDAPYAVHIRYPNGNTTDCPVGTASEAAQLAADLWGTGRVAMAAAYAGSDLIVEYAA